MLRRYSTQTAAESKSRFPLYLTGATAAGAGGYYYYFHVLNSGADVPVVTRRQQEKSPLDPEQFLDFRLKKVIPYNHNSSTYVHFT